MTPGERWSQKALRSAYWSPHTQPPAYPSSPSGVAASRRRLQFASTPPPAFNLSESPPESPARHRHPLFAFHHHLYGEIPDSVRDAFFFYDANHSGFLDYLELRAALRGYGYEADINECVDLVRQYDDDLDGKLSLYEFSAVILDLARHEQHALLSSTGYAAQDVREAFEQYDSNGSGYLDYIELQAALRGYGFDATVGESVELLRQYDDRFDGRLDLASFAALVDDLSLASHAGWRLAGGAGSDHHGPDRRISPRPVLFAPTPTWIPPVPSPPFVPAPMTVQHVPFGGRMIAVAPSLAYTAAAAAADAAAAAEAAHLADHDPILAARITNRPSYRPSSAAAEHHQRDVFSGINYLRPLVSAAVRLAFERFDDTARGVLDAGRARAALGFLGALLTHGDTAALLRRFGGYVPDTVDAVCSLPQFGAIVNHLREVGMPMTNPFLTAHRSDIHPVPPEGTPVTSEALISARRWYGFEPYPAGAHRPHDRPSAAPDFSFKPRISPASGKPSLY